MKRALLQVNTKYYEMTFALMVKFVALQFCHAEVTSIFQPCPALRVAGNFQTHNP